MKKKIVPIAAFAALFAANAHAQAVPDINDSITEGSQIDDIIRQQDRIGSQLGQDSNEIDGEAGIFVLRANEIFYVGGSYGIGYSENPQRTVDGDGDSFLVNLAATAGVQTRIAEAVDFGISATVGGTEYNENFAPSSRSISGAITAGTQVGQSPVYLGFTAFGGFNYDDSFNNGTGFYGGSASVSAGFALGPRTAIRPSISGTRQWSDISENDSTSVTGGVSVTHAVATNFSIGASTRVTHTWFDNFFEDVTFVKRKDWQYGGGINATYRVNDNILLGAAAGYEKRDSTFFVSEYESFEASLTFSARLRF